jgi:MiaB-like tRNA modifying enzyme
LGWKDIRVWFNFHTQSFLILGVSLDVVKVGIETYGCTMNRADSDIMRGIIARNFELADISDAEVVVVNTCGVIGFTERKILRRIGELKKEGKRVVVAGCLPRITRKKVEIADAAISPDNVHLVDLAIRSALDGHKLFLTEKNELDKAALSKVKCRLKENAIAIVSISEGCLGKCSFCATRFARGRLRSFSLDKIVEEIEDALKSGFKEIQLTSQDTGAYGIDRGCRLPELLNAISRIDGDFRVRVGMMNPNHAIRMVDELINAFKSEKIYKFIHLPVQSGDNRVLKEMRRDHTVEDFIEVVSAFRKNFSDVVVSTDLIAGFPTESEQSFWKSYELIREVKPDIVNITRYSERSKTPAAKLKDLPDWIKKERSRKLTSLARKIGLKRNRKFVGEKFRVLITKRGKENFLSRTDSYRPVVLSDGRIGGFYLVKIINCSHNHLTGKLEKGR